MYTAYYRVTTFFAFLEEGADLTVWGKLLDRSTMGTVLSVMMGYV